MRIELWIIWLGIGVGGCILFALWAAYRIYDTKVLGDAATEGFRRQFIKLGFSQLEAGAMLLLMVASLLGLLLLPQLSIAGRAGLSVALLLFAFRFVRTSLGNRLLLKDIFLSAAKLQQNYAEKVLSLQATNNQLTHLLGLNKNYKFLLNARDDVRPRPLTEDSLQELTEELVHNWFTRVGTISYLSFSLETANGDVYHEAKRGAPDHPDVILRVCEQIKVEDLSGPLKRIRFVTLTAEVRTGENGERELEPAFFRFLLLHVHDYLLRCMDNRRSLAFRDMEKEMELAQRIQSLLIPGEKFSLERLKARAVYSPVTYVGGDYIDYIQMDERYTCFIVADVSGHGLPASMLATGIRSAVRSVVQQQACAPDEILGRLNRLLYEDLSRTRSFITALVMVYDGEEHKLLVSRAGHPHPLYLSDSKHVILPCKGGVGLGLLPDYTYALEEIALQEAGLILVYTDGLLNAGRNDPQTYPQQWLQDLGRLLKEPDVTSENAIDRVEEFIWDKTKSGQQTDDIAVLILQFQTGEEQRIDHKGGSTRETVSAPTANATRKRRMSRDSVRTVSEQS